MNFAKEARIHKIGLGDYVSAKPTQKYSVVWTEPREGEEIEKFVILWVLLYPDHRKRQDQIKSHYRSCEQVY